MRSPLAYPLNRGADMDAGGAADLQTDVMRFMAILSLCLVAIFALVQSMPVAPPVSPPPEAKLETAAESPPVPVPVAEPVPEPQVVEPPKTVTLTRPKWVPKVESRPAPSTTAPVAAATLPPVASADEPEGFTLRFESDSALMRLVGASQVGVYAIDGERAQRMTVGESRISFWDASMPNSFHEMDSSTVPAPVLDAITRTGVDAASIGWGVTLPGKLKGQLEGLTHEHRGGSLVIETNGNIRLEAP
jgi:hypothetical protein